MKSYSTDRDHTYSRELEAHLQLLSASKPLSYIANGFSKYARRQEITRFLARHELFQKILEVQGSIVECGVYAGQGLFTWAQLSSILEPVGGAFREVIGFDTFSGFPSVDKKDNTGALNSNWQPGDLSSDSYDDLTEVIRLYDLNRFLPQFPKVKLIKGDFCETSKEYLTSNPHTLVSLLYLDFDIYEPTKVALETFLPRMPKGSIICFDEVNHPMWPGETLALLESLNINKYTLKKFSYDINISYIVL